MKKLTFDYVKSYIESFNYQLLSKKYINNSTKLKIQCDKGHIYKVKFNYFKTGNRCPVCFGSIKHTFEYVKSYIESFNYQLLSTEYINARSKLKVQCNKGHIYNVTFNDFKSGYRCKKCGHIKSTGKRKLSYNHVKSYIESFNYQLLSTVYINNRTKLKIQCDKRHEYEATFGDFKTGNRCPVCNANSLSSKPEREIQKYISTIYNGKIINNDRNTIINPLTGYNLELDIYLPEINKAIEFNGTY